MIKRVVYISLFVLMVAGFLSFAKNPHNEGIYYVPNFKGGEVRIVAERRQEGQRLDGRGWNELASSRPIELLLSLPSGREEVIEANLPGRRFIFPWSGYAESYSQQVRLYNPKRTSNAVRVMFSSGQGDIYWQDLYLREEETVVDVPEGMAWVDVQARKDVVAYVIWKQHGRVEWIDRGESDGGEEGEYAHAIMVRDSAVAVQVEIQGEGVVQLQRSAWLRPEVSLVSHTDRGVTRAVWTATDLQPIGTSVLGILKTNEPGVELKITELIASDAEANRIELDLWAVELR